MPAGTTATPNTTILSAAYNALVADLTADLNTARPITAGGTGGTSQITGWDGISAAGTDVASAATLVLSTATGPFIDITGTTSVTAVTLAAGTRRIARAAAAFRLTASASLIVNNSTTNSYTTAAGDLLFFEGYGSSVVRVWVISTPLYGLTSYPPGTLYGLTLSNNAGDATNDIDIAVGSARNSADSANMDLLTAMGKQLDVAWAVGGTTGSTLGMLATGSAVGNNRYFIFLIKRPDTGVVDVAADTSSTGANIATNTNANYTILRAIGEVTRAGGINGVPIWYGTTPINGTWTPTDASGAALSLTNTAAACTYVKIGKLVTVWFRTTYPVTGSGANATLGGLPFTSLNNGVNIAAGTVWSSASNPNGLLAANLASNATTFGLINNTIGTNILNSDLTGKVVTGVLSYMATA